VGQLAVRKWHTSKHATTSPNVITNKYQMALGISIGAAILNSVLLPKVALIGSGISHYYIVAIPLVLAFPVGLIGGGVFKKWSLEFVFFSAMTSTFLLVIAISWIEVLNVKLDDQEPEFKQIAIASKFIAGGKSRSPYRVSFRMPNSESMGELPLSREMFESIRVGDLLLLKIGDGYFGVPWVKGFPVMTTNRLR
jgi:hypothetical protein